MSSLAQKLESYLDDSDEWSATDRIGRSSINYNHKKVKFDYVPGNFEVFFFVNGNSVNDLLTFREKWRLKWKAHQVERLAKEKFVEDRTEKVTAELE